MNRLGRPLTHAYLAGSRALAQLLLRGRSGERDFRQVAVVAALSRTNGISRGAELQWAALHQCGIAAELVDATPALRNPLFRARHRPASAYVFHAGGPQTANLVASVLPHAAAAHRVAYWAWELPDPPPGWAGCDRAVAEIWTPSSFSRASLTRLSTRPVVIVPHHVPAAPTPRRRRAGRLTVLTIADSRSSFSRKNPQGALRAFHAAFGASPEAHLILKLSGHEDALLRLEASLAPLLRQPNVTVLKGLLDQEQLDALYGKADVLLSLHRAEGFGLPMREAMARGLPVVATGWSGNLDFMDQSNACLIPYRLVAVQDRWGVYAGSLWAEPDLDAAAGALQRLARDPLAYERIAAAAYASTQRVRPGFPFSSSGGQAAEAGPAGA